MVSYFLLFLVAVVSHLASTSSQLTPSDFLITDLPLYNGTFSDLGFNQYSGYLPLLDVDDSALFFWFVEAQKNPDTAPLVLWLNGGPGSSSIAYGFWTEHGPFRLQVNAAGVNNYGYSWNSVANVIYVESPSGVGFSYSNKSSGYTASDEKSASQNYLFLVAWFKVFTQFAQHDFYLTGESYGGHYIPQLANYILDNNNGVWNMKGFLIGNPGINSDWYYNTNEYAFQTYLFSHALLPQTAWLKSNEACGWDEFLTDCSKDFTHPSAQCEAANTLAYQYIPRTWDPYDIYAPTCQPSEDSKFDHISGSQFVREYTPFLEHIKQKYSIDTEYNPCIDNWTPEYMNMESVLKAIHAYEHYDRHWPRLPAGWNYKNETEDVAKIFPNFFNEAPEWRISVVSGDADAAVPFLGTQRWIECLGRTVVKDWFNWFIDGDVAGSVKIYDGITFQSVKMCGHTIPTYCPLQGLLFFQQYLNGSFAS